jgi:hypothetical protein
MLKHNIYLCVLAYLCCGNTDQQTISCTNDRALWFTDHSSGICQCVSGIDSISMTETTTNTTAHTTTDAAATTNSTDSSNSRIPLAPQALPKSPPLSVAVALQPPRPASRRQIALQQHLRRMRALQTYDYVTTARDTLLHRIQQYHQQQQSCSSRCFSVWKAFELLRKHRCPLITKGVTANHVELLVLTALDIQAKVCLYLHCQRVLLVTITYLPHHCRSYNTAYSL